MRLLTIILILLLSWSATANEIDGLKTKQDVQDFLMKYFGKTGLINLYKCPQISQAEKTRMEFFQPDTFMVEDPITQEMVMTFVPRDSSFFNNIDARYFLPTEKYDTAWARQLSKNPYYNFHKADLDGNKRTDLVVDAGTVIIVMDMGNKFEGHVLILGGVKFNNFLPLPDGSVASLIEHDHNLCPSPPDAPMKNTYLTDTMIDNTVDPPVVTIDTFLIVAAYPRSGPQCHKIDTVVYKFGGFAEYNPRFKRGGISKIMYRRQHSIYYGRPANGFNSCLEIDSSGNCYLRYSDYDTSFFALLNKTRVRELFDNVAYVDVKSKKDRYPYDYVSYWSPVGGGSFLTHFTDGTVKAINIWESGPPLGLDYLLEKIVEISGDLQWQKVDNARFSCPQTDIPGSDYLEKRSSCECDGL